jgi:hypothetical protein
MGRITVALLTNLAKHLGIPMSVMELLLFSRHIFSLFFSNFFFALLTWRYTHTHIAQEEGDAQVRGGELPGH